MCLRPDSIDWLFPDPLVHLWNGNWKIFKKNRNLFSHYCIFMQIFASFSFYFYFYPSRPFQMGPGKIWETTNQLSLALPLPHHYTYCSSASVGSNHCFQTIWTYRNYNKFRFAQQNYDLTVQLLIILTGLLASNFAWAVWEYFKDGGPKSTPECTMWYTEWHLVDA